MFHKHGIMDKTCNQIPHRVRFIFGYAIIKPFPFICKHNPGVGHAECNIISYLRTRCKPEKRKFFS